MQPMQQKDLVPFRLDGPITYIDPFMKYPTGTWTEKTKLGFFWFRDKRTEQLILVCQQPSRHISLSRKKHNVIVPTLVPVALHATENNTLLVRLPDGLMSIKVGRVIKIVSQINQEITYKLIETNGTFSYVDTNRKVFNNMAVGAPPLKLCFSETEEDLKCCGCKEAKEEELRTLPCCGISMHTRCFYKVTNCPRCKAKLPEHRAEENIYSPKK